MDIKIKRWFYPLKTMDGKYHIYQRDEIFSPLLSVKQLDSPVFVGEKEAQRFADKMNEDKDGNIKSVTI